MSSRGIIFASLFLAAAAFLFVPAASAQNPVTTHIGHVATGFPAAPDGAGLLSTALAEAEIAALHARLAGNDPSNLDAVKAHTGHVLHALQPAEGDQGPGKGFGVIRASEAVAAHIGMAANADGASQGVTTHAGHIAAAATGAAARAAEAVEVARQIQAARNYADAESLLPRLRSLTQQIVDGVDADENGTIGWQEGEGGLMQAETHLDLLRRAEGLQ